MDLFTAANNYTRTENGALTYKSSFNKNLDLFFLGGAARKYDMIQIRSLVADAWNEDPKTCLKVLLFLRDIREGAGEKRIYREAMNYILPKVDKRTLIEATIEMGSWKDVFQFLPLDAYKDFVKERYEEHVKTQSYDLMEKYMPSIGGKWNSVAEQLAKHLGLTPKEYRKYLSKARASLKVVERNLCAKTYEEIDYSKLPSQAGLRYRNAFMNHDGERYKEYLNEVTSGKKKMNTSTLAPYEILKPLIMKAIQHRYKEADNVVIETAWNEFTKKIIPAKRGIVVADVSGSMCYDPLCISVSLGMFYAQCNNGIFHNKLITFSQNPNFITFEDSDSLEDKIDKIVSADWGMNTDLEAVFDLILKTAVEYHLPESEMPEVVYIVSDMELDICTSDSTNFEYIKKLYKESGYEMPTLVFWNVNSHGRNVPVKSDENNTILLSGASANLFNIAVNGNINPLEIMMKTIQKYDDWALRIIGN